MIRKSRGIQWTKKSQSKDWNDLRIILWFGVVGKVLVKLFDSRAEDLYAKYGLKPRVVGVFDSKGSAVDSSGLEFNKLVEVKKSLEL